MSPNAAHSPLIIFFEIYGAKRFLNSFYFCLFFTIASCICLSFSHEEVQFLLLWLYVFFSGLRKPFEVYILPCCKEVLEPARNHRRKQTKRQSPNWSFSLPSSPKMDTPAVPWLNRSKRGIWPLPPQS